MQQKEEILKSDKKLKEEKVSCSICLETEEKNDKWMLSDCGEHHFHKACISQWEYNSCPNCRKPVDNTKEVTKPVDDAEQQTQELIDQMLGEIGNVPLILMSPDGQIHILRPPIIHRCSDCGDDTNNVNVECPNCHNKICFDCLDNHNCMEDISRCTFCQTTGIHRICEDGCNSLPWCYMCYDDHECR